MQIKEAIILAGGLGTRLRAAVPDLPKCMAPVAGHPFLTYVIRFLLSQGIEKFIFSLGYRHEIIKEFLNTQYPTLNIQYSTEDEPLGTGGAIKLACDKATETTVLVVNGDTLFKAKADQLFNFHQQHTAECTLALKPMNDFDRYGIVELDKDGSVKSFKEKQFYQTGSINGGVYLLNVAAFLSKQWPLKFSFEKDYLEKNTGGLFGNTQDEYFIDIGIPGDYNRAQKELQLPPLDLDLIDHSWTLFVDRDGVINQEKKDEYVHNWKEFKFYDGVKEAFQIFGKKFGKVIIISNQRGVGRKLMTEDDLRDIHKNMQAAIEAAGGRIDKIYYCTSPDSKNICRKPNPGMAFLAKKDIPGIDFARSIMIGNKPTDMLFGRYAGIHTVFVRTTNPLQPFPHPHIDLVFDSLADFAKAL